ncbi:hypothetical protein [Tenacibaculum aiptasiae]|uniref:hypothetical protein n=1 Tax=Tenacibaculum aiptasiae TaxID=426481 RepID=UPI002330F97E|nr:hypothetical protein [Tenacibaculum aiptasiae]
MKYLKVITLFFVVVVTNSSAQKLNKIIYKAHTRGTAIEIRVEENTIKYQKNGKKLDFKLSEEEVGRFEELIKKINLSELEVLKSPTNRRNSDGALIASFIIEVGKKEYSSSTFDAGNPPKELKKLEDVLTELVKLREQKTELMLGFLLFKE